MHCVDVQCVCVCACVCGVGVWLVMALGSLTLSILTAPAISATPVKDPCG